MSAIGIPMLDNLYTRSGRDICSRAEYYARYDHLISKNDMSKLNDTERKFVTGNVQQKILWGRPLTDKQMSWMLTIMKKYPAPRATGMQEYEWQ